MVTFKDVDDKVHAIGESNLRWMGEQLQDSMRRAAVGEMREEEVEETVKIQRKWFRGRKHRQELSVKRRHQK